MTTFRIDMAQEKTSIIKPEAEKLNPVSDTIPPPPPPEQAITVATRGATASGERLAGRGAGVMTSVERVTAVAPSNAGTHIQKVEAQPAPAPTPAPPQASAERPKETADPIESFFEKNGAAVQAAIDDHVGRINTEAYEAHNIDTIDPSGWRRVFANNTEAQGFINNPVMQELGKLYRRADTDKRERILGEIEEFVGETDVDPRIVTATILYGPRGFET